MLHCSWVTNGLVLKLWSNFLYDYKRTSRPVRAHCMTSVSSSYPTNRSIISIEIWILKCRLEMTKIRSINNAGKTKNVYHFRDAIRPPVPWDQNILFKGVAWAQLSCTLLSAVLTLLSYKVTLDIGQNSRQSDFQATHTSVLP